MTLGKIIITMMGNMILTRNYVFFFSTSGKEMDLIFLNA